jgi:hypothetical protein
MKNGPLTPKEFAADVFDGKRSARWVRARCREYIRTHGKKGIAVISRQRPYLIPREEVGRVAIALFKNLQPAA